jgi:hypothetical protein
MSQGVKAGTTRKGSGRVTPSKLRRGAVVAADGVLVIGTSAVAALFGTGTAVSVGAPTPGWTGLQVPTPTGLNAPASNPHGDISTEGCASAVSCAAAGSYGDTGSNTQGLLESLSRGTWSSVEAPLPSDAYSNPDPAFYDMACPSNGSCVAVGAYKNNTNTGSFPPKENALIEMLNGGVWTPTEAPLPNDAAGLSSSFNWLKSVSCPDSSDCTAVGYYKNTSGHDVGLIETYAGGRWTAQIAPQVSDADTHNAVELAGVSCPSLGNCVADGEYEPNATGTGLELLTESGGTWTASVAPLPSDTATGSSQDARVSPLVQDQGQNLSCAGTQCEIAGVYTTTSGGDAPLLLHASGSTWTAPPAPIPVPSNAAMGANESAVLLDASCGFDGGCTAVGNFYDGTDTRPLIERTSPAGVVTAMEAPEPADHATGTNVDASLAGVSCLSSTDCTAVGSYANDTSSNQVGFIATLSGGSWSAQPAAVPNNAGGGGAAASGLSSVACSGRGACLAGGYFEDASANQFGLFDSYTPAEGYWLDAADGGVFAYPSATFLGSMGGTHLNAPMVGMATTPGDGGYWLVGADGGVFTFGNAKFYGSTGGLHLNAPIVGMAATPDGRGYWLVAADGGIFNYGDAGFFGSSGGVRLNKPVVGMAPTASGMGYWLVGSDGGIFTYGDGVFYGSMGGVRLNKPVVGMAANVTGNGYWLVASDGGIFGFGDALFHGSTGSITLNKPVVGMMPTFDGMGYFLVASDGGIFNYGDAGFYGSAGNLKLVSPVVGGSPS